PPRRCRRALRGFEPAPVARAPATNWVGRGPPPSARNDTRPGGGPLPTCPYRRCERRGIPVLLRGESRLASRGRRRALLLEPARRPRAAGRGRPVFRRWLPRASRAASRRERGDKEGGEAVYRGDRKSTRLNSSHDQI